MMRKDKSAHGAKAGEKTGIPRTRKIKAGYRILSFMVSLLYNFDHT